MKKYDMERMELSTRDKVAIANYSEIISGRTSPNGGFLDISHKSKDFILSKSLEFIGNLLNIKCLIYRNKIYNMLQNITIRWVELMLIQ